MSKAHKQSGSISQNQKAQLANAYNELGKELSSSKLRVIGNYTLGRVIGEGAYGTVRLGTHRLTSTRVAIKQIPKEMSASLTREIHHHRQLHHPHITQMFEVIASEKHIWIVTELCSGGELFDYLAEKGRLTEDEARFLFGQLCLAVAYLHDKGIVHRDLKLENVLLDERCRVKLGDFGFTREYERGALMETFCGTTGYAAPEMLQAQRYLGPEVDIWSLGVILYCLLTGMLPFDDDDEAIMREKVIISEFEDPEWLSDDVRDLIKNILVKDPTKRLSIPQILSHRWFTSPTQNSSSSVPKDPASTAESSVNSDISSSGSIEPGTSAPTTPAMSSDDPFEMPSKPNSNVPALHPNLSETTIRKEFASQAPIPMPTIQPEIVEEEESDDKPTLLLRQRTNSSDSRSIAPPVNTLRTPARTKRRSVSSTLSDPDFDHDPTDTNNNGNNNTTSPAQSHLPSSTQRDRDVNFSSLLSTPAPIIFSTPLERDLLNAMNALGFDLGQIVYSVLNDACDASGALWWMLKRKSEKRVLGGGDVFSRDDGKESEVDVYLRQSHKSKGNKGQERDREKEKEDRHHHHKHRHRKHAHTVGIQTDPASPTSPVPPPVPEKTSMVPLPLNILLASAPALTLVPATPTYPPPRVTTPPHVPVITPMLTPSSSAAAVSSDASSTRSHPNTPSGSGSGFSALTGSTSSSKTRKNRAGSVSIMQRASNALEAAGLVRKKSSEAVKEDRERDRDREREKSKDGEKERKNVGVEADLPPHPRSSHGSSSSGGHKLTKSPPLRAAKGTTTPPPLEHPQPHAMGSPWIMAESNESLLAHSTHSQAHSQLTKRTTFTPANSPAVGNSDVFSSESQPNLSEAASNGKGSTGSNNGRNRANLLSAFRLWFHEDRKGKRKEGHNPIFGNKGSRINNNGTNMHRTTSNGGEKGTAKRRNNPTVRGSARRNRPSVSSRRSSSVNSRRSSITSVQMVVLTESPTVAPPRRSMGSHTPNSERGEYSSRPSSVRSFSMQQRHRKSPSASSTGSLSRSQSLNRAASPIRYHKRGGSGSSTRVVRQAPKSIQHGRSNSTASSVHHSPVSSRPTSFIEYSDYEGQRTASPYRSRRHSDEMSTPRKGRGDSTATFVAHRRGAPFASPLTGYSGYGTIGKSSWKKSWGLEPPGWQTRTAHLPVEVLAISPEEGTSLRDVFSGTGRQSLSLGDESDWVDEDEEIPYAGGLGQLTLSLGKKSSGSSAESTPIVSTPPVLGRRGNTGSKRSTAKELQTKMTAAPPANPVETYDSDMRAGRRQLPPGRSGPAFKQAIQEEDEDEEE